VTAAARIPFEAIRRRRLPGVLTLRDVRDVEQHVEELLAPLGLAGGELDRAVLQAIGTAYRIDRALQPERPLRPVLDSVIGPSAVRERETASAALANVA